MIQDVKEVNMIDRILNFGVKPEGNPRNFYADVAAYGFTE